METIGPFPPEEKEGIGQNGGIEQTGTRFGDKKDIESHHVFTVSRSVNSKKKFS